MVRRLRIPLLLDAAIVSDEADMARTRELAIKDDPGHTLYFGDRRS